VQLSNYYATPNKAAMPSIAEEARQNPRMNRQRACAMLKLLVLAEAYEMPFPDRRRMHGTSL
jgi:hypothetical protein